MLSWWKPAWFALPILLLSSVSAQTGQQSVAPIASALRNRQFAEAVTLLRTALQQSPRNAQLWTMQGVAFQGEGDSKQALASFRRALKLAPDAIPALEGAAQIEYDAGDAAGIPVLERLLRLRPDDVTSHGMLAVLEYQQGDCSAAIVHFEKAAALFADRLPALHAYGTCLVKLRRFNQAAGVFQQSLALDADNPKERQVLASVQLMAAQPQKALDTLQPLAQSAPDAKTLELTSSAWEDLHETDRAVDALRRAILLNPNNVSLYVNFAALSARHDSYKVGIDAVNDGLHLEPQAAPLYFARGMLWVQLGDYAKAEADFEKAYSLDPKQSLSVAAQTLTAAERGDITQALADVQQKLAHRPDDPILLYLQADILSQQEAAPGSPAFQLAVRSAKRAVALRSGLGPAHGVLAKLYLLNKQYAEAAAQCRKVLELDPTDQTAVYRLVMALRNTSAKSEIPGLLKRLVALRQQSSKEERAEYSYKLIEGGPGNPE